MQGLHNAGLEIRMRRQSSFLLGAVRVIPADLAAVPWKTRVEDVLARALAVELDSKIQKRPATKARKKRPRRAARS
jgi:uncharacterized protein YbaP (TraB family)